MFIEFALQYWYLFLMLLIILVMLSINPGSRGAAGAKKVSALQLPQLQNRQSAVILNVSEPDVYKEGHIAQSINIPLAKLSDKIKKIEKYKNKPIILTCPAGNQAAKAASVLKSKEFNDLYILDGGLAAWRKENLPLVKG